MELVKEHINEKFVENSDPISDMGIGLMPQIKKFIREETNYTDVESDYLWICAEHGKIEFVKYLIEKGADVHARNDEALRLASNYGYADIVKLLLDAGVKADIWDNGPLMYASENDHVEVVKLLLAAGADVSARNNLALNVAIERNNTEVVKVLLDAGADVHAWGDGALRMANKYGHVEIVKILKDHIAKEKKKKRVKESLNEKFTEDSDPIEDMGIGPIPQIKKFIKEETKYVDAESDYLWICAKHGKLEFVKYLIDKGADVHAEDDWALQLASAYGHPEVVKVLLDAGADIHALNDAALRRASYYGHPDVVKVLLDAGADVHARDDWALRVASENGHPEVVKLLLDAGADVHAGDDAALRWASEEGHAEVVKVLKDHIAKEKKKKKVKESLNEKFLEDSDPISDMGIGLKYIYDNLKVGNILKFKKDFKASDKSRLYEKGSYLKIIELHKWDNKSYGVRTAFFRDKKDLLAGKLTLYPLDWFIKYEFFKEYFFLVKIEDLVENLNEKFVEDSDPIRDMEIGIIKFIKKWLKENESNLGICTINPDLTIDTRYINFYKQNTRNFPEFINFNNVSGYLCFHGCGLTSLRGFPKKIYGNLFLGENKLKNLKYLPKEIVFDLMLFSNELTSLIGCPNKIKGEFNCSKNPLRSLEGMPTEIFKNFICYDTPLSEDYIINYLKKNKVHVGGKIILYEKDFRILFGH